MKKFKGMVILGSFIFINSMVFAVTDAQFNDLKNNFNALKNHYNNFGRTMGDWTNNASGQINTINTKVTNLENNALVKDGSNVKASEFRGNLDVYSKNEVDDLLDNKADKNDVYTKNEIDNSLNGKADANNVYTKIEVNNSLDNKADKNDVYTKNEVDDSLNKKADKNDVYTKNEIDNSLNEKISNVKDEVNYVGSLSAALAGLHPMQYDPKTPTQVMAALGNYKNKQSVAVGLSYYFNDRFMVSTGVAIGGEKRTKSMTNVGFTLKLGKGSGVTYQETPQYVVQNEVKRLTVENQELKERVKNLEDKLNKILEVK